MLKILLAASLALAGAPVPAPAPTPVATGFQLVVTPTTSGYAMHCESGCAWVDLTIDCAGECRAVVDANGVYLNAQEKQGSPAFAFRFHSTRGGWELDALGGSRWSHLGWGCGWGNCAARVTDTGVTGT